MKFPDDQALRTLQLLGQSVFRRKSFSMDDYRTVAHATYDFDVAYQT